MKVIFLSVRFPCGRGEEFFGAEVSELIATCPGSILLAPVRPRWRPGTVPPVYAGWMAKGSFKSWLRGGRILWKQRHKILHVARHYLREQNSFAGRLKNVLGVLRGCHLGALGAGLGVDHYHALWASTPAVVAHAAAAASGGQWSFTCHRGDIKATAGLASKVAGAQFVRCISESGRRRVAAAARPVDGFKIKVLRLGITLPAGLPGFQNRTPLTFLTAARLVAVKGHAVLLRSLAALPPEIRARVRLLWAGSGPLEKTLKAQAHELGVADRLEILGYCDHPRLMGLFRDGEIDGVILPSVTTPEGEHEGVPVCLMEAMAWGCPVIATHCGATAELVTESCGILVPESDDAGLSAAIEDLAESRELRQRLGEAGRVRVLREFNAEVTAGLLWKAICNGVSDAPDLETHSVTMAAV